MRLGTILLLLAVTLTASLPAQSIAGFSTRVFSPETVFRAFQQAYPGLVTTHNQKEGPVVVIAGRAFSWAEGRLLPFEDRVNWAENAPHSFYDYPKDAPDVTDWPADKLARAEERLANRLAANLKRDPSFYDALWGIRNRATADAAQRRVRFLGLQVTVHKMILEPLRRVEARLAEARTAPEVDAFLKELSRLEGYNWRDIAGTQSRSNHAYGTAIDIIPRSYRGKNPYWLWAQQDSAGWYRSAWNARWQVPVAVVKAFEAEGFVWGGKWLMFDTIHFEYRPEILILNGFK